jgi:patatin-like phospholipase/acyl hydrolase
MKGLALDGGGVRGVGQAAILAGAKDPHKFDFVAGTSIGAVNATYAAMGLDMHKAVGFFSDYAPQIFAQRWWRQYKRIGPRYSDKALNSVLRDTFPGRFGDLAVPTFIAAADMNRKRLKVFSSVDADDGVWPTWEVVRTAVAAETYFLPWKGFADAGIIANNPAMVAVTGACRELRAKVSDIELLSIGTGVKTHNQQIGSTRLWPRLRWGMWILRALMDGFTVSMHEAFAESMPLKKYERIQFHSEASWQMDDPRLVNRALSAWSMQIEAGIRVVDKF